MDYFIIILSAVFVNNIVLTQFLGMCPFLGVTNRISLAVGMGGALIFVLTLSGIVTYLLDRLVLVPFHIEFIQIVAFILIVAALVQLLEIVLKKTIPSLYQALGIFLPLITTNCIVLAVPLLMLKRNYPIVKAVLFAAANGLGFTLALVLLAGLREQMELIDVPEGMRGIPITLVTAGLLSLAFMGFAGIG